MREVYPNVFMEVFPLTNNPLREINIFVIKSPDLNMIIDTGFNNDENRGNMNDLIRNLELDLSKTILFLTHLHSDHVGLASYLQDLGISKIYLPRVDGDLLKTGVTVEGKQWQTILNNAHRQGLDIDNLDINQHPGYKNRPQHMFDYVPVDVGDRLSIGYFNFVVIDEKGHTPGMVGLYDADKEVLFCGDHILGKITPNITDWGSDYGDSLADYLDRLQKIKELKIKHLFSAHRHLVEDVYARIDEIVKHHEVRLNEALELIRKYQPCSVRDLVIKMHWDIRAKDWNEFPQSQKWFAAGEAAAHVVYLLNKGLIKEEIADNGVAFYSII